MREVLSVMPEVKAPHNRCCRCGDKIVPRLKVYIGIQSIGRSILRSLKRCSPRL